MGNPASEHLIGSENKAVTVFCLLSIFTSSPLLTHFSHTFRFSTISSTFSPKMCLRYVKHSCGHTWTEFIEPLGCPCGKDPSHRSSNMLALPWRSLPQSSFPIISSIVGVLWRSPNSQCESSSHSLAEPGLHRLMPSRPSS